MTNTGINKGLLRVHLFLLLILLSAGCTKYHGDGTYKEYPPLSNQCKYEVDFGNIDLNTKGSHVYRFTGVPSSEYWLRLRLAFVVSTLDQSEAFWKMRCQPDAAKVEIAVKIFDERGRIVIATRGTLSGTAWHWSQAQVGDLSALKKGGTVLHEYYIYPKVHNKDVFFPLKARRRYTLQLTVLKAATDLRPEARVLLQGGFWK